MVKWEIDANKIKNIKHIFFFRQRTAYEMRLSLVGSEMCRRDGDPIPTGSAAAGETG